MGEKISTFYNLLNGMEGKEYIETFISYNVALISARLKPSITLNLSKYDNKDIFYLWNIYGKDYLKRLNLDYISLRDSDKSLIVLIYDKELLEKYINKKDILKIFLIHEDNYILHIYLLMYSMHLLLIALYRILHN